MWVHQNASLIYFLNCAKIMTAKSLFSDLICGSCATDAELREYKTRSTVSALILKIFIANPRCNDRNEQHTFHSLQIPNKYNFHASKLNSIASTSR